MMDRWQIEFSAPETGEEEQGDPVPCNIINNYFSIGVVSTHPTPCTDHTPCTDPIPCTDPTPFSDPTPCTDPVPCTDPTPCTKTWQNRVTKIACQKVLLKGSNKYSVK